MKNPFSDKLALSTAVVGVVLMALTIAFRVNPVEGSVVSDCLRTAWGRPLHLLLLVTTMPAWIAAIVVTFGGDLLTDWHLPYIVMLILQALLFFGIGKLM